MLLITKLRKGYCSVSEWFFLNRWIFRIVTRSYTDVWLEQWHWCRQQYSRPIMLHLPLIFTYIIWFILFDCITKCLRIYFFCIFSCFYSTTLTVITISCIFAVRRNARLSSVNVNSAGGDYKDIDEPVIRSHHVVWSVSAEWRRYGGFTSSQQWDNAALVWVARAVDVRRMSQRMALYSPSRKSHINKQNLLTQCS